MEGKIGTHLLHVPKEEIVTILENYGPYLKNPEFDPMTLHVQAIEQVFHSLYFPQMQELRDEYVERYYPWLLYTERGVCVRTLNRHIVVMDHNPSLHACDPSYEGGITKWSERIEWIRRMSKKLKKGDVCDEEYKAMLVIQQTHTVIEHSQRKTSLMNLLQKEITVKGGQSS